MIYFAPVTEQDRDTLEYWISQDPWHKETCTPDFWISPPANSYSFQVGDDDGPVLFMRIDNEGTNARMHTEFIPGNAKRIAKTLHEGFPILRDLAKQKGMQSISFESTSPLLIGFMERYFNFKAEYRCQL